MEPTGYSGPKPGTEIQVTRAPETVVSAVQGPVSSGRLLDRLVERVNPHFAILFFLPWVLFLVNPNWMFQGFGHMDPWYYFGMSIDFPRYQHLFIPYSAERLTWILPARLFVAILSPVYGWLVFHVCVYCTATFSLYSIVRRLFDSQTAILTAMMMGCHPLFIGSNGWTYVDSGSLAYLALTFAALTGVRGARRPSAYITVAGIFWAASAYTYPLWWILTPCCALFYWGVADVDSDRKLFRPTLDRYLRSVAFFGSGLLITTALMMLCNYCVHGSGGGFFYAKNLAMINFHLTVKKEQVTWGSESYAWVKTASWIVFPVLTMIACIVASVQHILRRVRRSRLVMGICMTYGYAFLALLYLQFRNTHVLEFDYYVSMLIPLEFLVLAALVYDVPRGVARPRLYWVLAAGAVITIMPLMRGVFYTPGSERTLVAHYVLGLAIICAVLLWNNIGTWACGVIGLAVVSFGLVPDHSGSAWVSGFNGPGSPWSSPFNGLAATRRVADAINAIDSNTPVDKYPVFWIDNYNASNTPEYRSIMCALQIHSSSMWRYPNVDPNRTYPPGTELIIITGDRDVESANETMTNAGMPLRMGKAQLISGEGNDPSKTVSYWLTFTEVLAPGAGAAASREELELIPNALKVSDFLPVRTPGVSVKTGPPVRITTSADQWAYAAYEMLPFSGQDRGKAQLRLVVKVLSGNVGLGILSTSEKGFYKRVTLSPSDAFQDVTLDIEHPEDCRKLVVENDTPGGKTAEVVVSRIDLLAYPSSSVSIRLASKDKSKIGER